MDKDNAKPENPFAKPAVTSPTRNAPMAATRAESDDGATSKLASMKELKKYLPKLEPETQSCLAATLALLAQNGSSLPLPIARLVAAYSQGQFEQPHPQLSYVGGAAPPDHIAVFRGDVPASWDTSCDVKIPQMDDVQKGFSTAHVAALAGKIEVLKHAPSDDVLDAVTSGGVTVLHCAVMGGHLDVVKFLLEKRPDVNRNGNVSPLWAACWQGHLDVVQYILSFKPSLIDVNRNNNVSPLFIACFEGHLDVVRYILSFKPSLIYVNRNDNVSPHGIAKEMANGDVVRLLDFRSC